MKQFLLGLLALYSLTAAAQTPLNLRQCIDRANERNLQVRQALLNCRQQEVNVSSARNARLPEVSASAGENLSFGRGITANNTYESRNTSSTSLSLGASMPLLTGGRIGHVNKQADLNLAAAVADVDRLREDLSLQVTQAYLQVIYYADVVTQTNENLTLALQQEEQVRKRIAAGRLPEVELAQATSRIAQNRLDLVQAKNNHHLALLSLSQLLEFSTPDSLAIVRPEESELRDITGNPEETYLLALSDRPSLRVADLRIRAAQEGIAIARAARYPTVSLTAGLGSNYYHTSGITNPTLSRQIKDNFSQSIGLSLNFPLFDRHATRNNIRQARLAVLEQQLALDNTKKTLYKEIQDAYYNALAAQQKYRAAMVAEEAAQVSLTTVIKKLEGGRATTPEFDEAFNKHFVAATNRISARYEFLFRSKILDFYRGTTLR